MGTNPGRRRTGIAVVMAVLISTAAAVAGIGTASAQTDIHLCALPGSATIDDPTNPGTDLVIPFYGFVDVTTTMPATGDPCAGAVPRFGDPTPVRMVEGQTYTVYVHNRTDAAGGTGFPINLLVAGLSGAPDLTGVAPGGDGTYTITAATPGTHMFESDLDPHHVPLGLHGVVVVDPATPGSATGAPNSAYDLERVLVFHEVDMALNTAPDPLAFPMTDWSPTIHLINGQTRTSAYEIPPIAAVPGDRVLVRYVNAAPSNSSIATLGLRQTVVNFDGEIYDGSGPVGEQPLDVSAVFLTSGQTADVVIEVQGAYGDRFPIYNRNLRTSAIGDNGEQLVMIEVGVGGGLTGDVYFSLADNVRTFRDAGPTGPGDHVTLSDEDIGVWNGTYLDKYFDGTVHGIPGSADIDAVWHDPATGDLYLSFRADLATPTDPRWAAVTKATIDESDVVHWNATADTFDIYVDHTTIGLNGSNAHDINGLQVDPASGEVTFTTNGSYLVPWKTGSATLIGARNEDISRWVPDNPGQPNGTGRVDVVADFSDFDMVSFNTNTNTPRTTPGNLDGISLTALDIFFTTTSTHSWGPTETYLAGWPAADANGFVLTDRDDILGCRGFTPAAPGTLNDTCLAFAFELDVDTLHHNGVVANVDALSVG